MSPNSKTKQTSIAEILRTYSHTLSAEIIPPRNGAELDVILEQIKTLAAVPVDFISVTRGAGGSLRGGTLPIAQLIKEQFGICSLAHFTCRDFTIEEVENTLMDHHYFGVSNILALRGDPPDGKLDHFKPAPNRHAFAWQLVEQIRHMNEGKYLVREGFDAGPVNSLRDGSGTNFCIGVAAHPDQEPLTTAVDHLAKKVDMGAKFAITQMIFSVEAYLQFCEHCQKRGVRIPIIPGLRIVTQAGPAVKMAERFGVKIPKSLVNSLEKAKSKDDGKKIGLELSVSLCEQLLRVGAPGLHVFVMSDAKSGADLLNVFKR